MSIILQFLDQFVLLVLRQLCLVFIVYFEVDCARNEQFCSSGNKIVFGKRPARILTGAPNILNEVFRDFPQIYFGKCRCSSYLNL
jgi:hypothetical protein